MADRTQTLLFLVDVQVRGANALRRLDADLDAAAAARSRRLLALNDLANGGGGTGPLPADTGATTMPLGGNGVRGRRPGAVIVDRGVQAGNGASDTAIVGVRGRQHPGSRINPVTTVQESGQAAGLGSLAAATGDNGRDQPAAPVPVVPVAAPASEPRRTPAMPDLGQMALFAMSQIARGPAGQQSLFGIEPAGFPRPAASRTYPVVDSTAMRQAFEASQRQGTAGTLAAMLAARQATLPRTLTAAAAAGRLGVPRSRVYELAGSGMLPGAVKQGGEWQIPEQAVTDMAAAGGAAGRGRGGNGGRDWRRALGFGAAASWLGLAGFGTLGSLAGLGPEHLLMTGVGLAGSLAGAGIGGGLLGLGAMGPLAVGAGSDAGVMASTIADTKTLATDYNNLAQAVALYGKSSTQATQAQKQLSFDMKNLGPGTQYEAQLARQANALNAMWDQTSGHARKLSVQILDQVLSLAKTMMPLVISAAQRNLAIVDNDIRPLFAWLQGPQGIQIWKDLENKFARDLPTAIGAFTQGIELLLRVVDIASQSTGGFIGYLDKLFTRLNGLNNGQLTTWVGRYVADFRLWEHFVRALIVDMARLFSNDAHTGNSIIAELTVMLDKLGQWESSVRGRQSLMTIFEVHKQEIDQLLQILPALVNGYAPIYMTLAPALTRAFTAVAGAIISVVKAVESIPGGSLALGAGLVLSKTSPLALLSAGLLGRGRGGRGSALPAGGLVVKDAAGNVTGSVAAGASGGFLSRILGRVGSTGIGSAVGGGVEAGTLGVAGGVEAAGFEGLAGALTAAGAAVAPIAAGLLPLLAVAGGIYGLVQLFGLFTSTPKVTRRYNTSQLQALLAAHGPAGLSMPGATQQTTQLRGRVPIRVTKTIPVSQAMTATQSRALAQQFVSIASSPSRLATQSIGRLQGLLREGQALAADPSLSKYRQEIERFVAAVQADLTPLSHVWDTISQRWASAVGKGLGSLRDMFDSNTKLIAHQIGLNSDNGKQMMLANVNDMISGATRSMLAGVVGVKAGMKAINDAVRQGAKDGAVSWQTGTLDMLRTVDSLYAGHKLTTKQYYADLQSITAHGLAKISDETKANGDAINAYIKHQLADGNLTRQSSLDKQHQMQTAANTQASIDMSAWVATILAAMQKSGGLTAHGMAVIAKEVNQALGLFGAAKLPIPSAIAWANYNAGNAPSSSYQASGPGVGHRATGGMLLDHPMFLAGEEGAAHPEYVLATNPAYRKRNLGLWAQAGQALGVPGFARGGIAAPRVGGGGTLGELDGDALRWVAKAADAYLSAHAPAGGGGRGAGSTAGLSGPLLAIVHQIARRMGWGSGLVQDWLNVIGAESGGSMTATNPHSGAYGIAQMNTGTGVAAAMAKYYSYGGNPHTMAGQLIAMANYMLDSYGGPAGAWRSEQTVHSYARGGRVKWAGRFADGGMVSADSPTLALFGENGPETAMFVPGFRRGGRHGRRAPGRLVGHGGGTLAYGATLPWSQSSGLAIGVAYFTDLLNQATTAVNALQTTTQNTSSLVGGLGSLAPGTTLQSLGLTGSALTATGMSAGTLRALIGGGPAADMAQIQVADQQLAAYQSQKSTLEQEYKGALKTHNRKLQAAITGELNTVDQAIVTATAQGQQALIAAIQATAQEYSDQATQAGGTVSLISAMQATNSPVSLAGLGVGAGALATVLAGSGVSPAMLAGIGGGPTAQSTTAANAAIATQIAADVGELNYYQSQLSNLTGPNLTSAEQTMQGLATSIVSLQGSIQSNTQALIAQTAQFYSDQAAAIGSSLSTLQAIQGLTGSESLSALGLSPAILATLGVGGAQGMVGSGLSAFQGFAQNQGGMLTPAQIAQATGGVNADNALLSSEEQPIAGELAYYQSQLPSLSGSSLTAAISTMGQLAQQLLGLQGSIDSNTSGLTALTNATNQNTSATTSATGAMTGSTSYSYQGQNGYLASLSSDSPTNVGVGL